MHRFKIVLLVAGAVSTMPAMAASPSNASSGSLPEPSEPNSATRGPEPLNNPGMWVTAQDYPSEALRDNTEGTVGFQLGISPAGRITDCHIRASSGSPVLDQATCQLIHLRAMFRPALEAGKPTAGTYSNRIRWVIPRPKKPMAGELIVSYLVTPDGTRSDCRVESAVGEEPLKMISLRNPCQPGSFESGYLDEAGRPVTRRVRSTIKFEVMPVP